MAAELEAVMRDAHNANEAQRQIEEDLDQELRALARAIIEELPAGVVSGA